MRISVYGAGAFGTAMAAVLARDGGEVTLWGRDAEAMKRMMTSRCNEAYLPNVHLPVQVRLTANLDHATGEDIALLAVPAQQIAGFWRDNGPGSGATTVIACAKGIDLTTGLGPAATLRAIDPARESGILTGPSFADELGRGLPTALTLAMPDAARAQEVAQSLSRTGFRLYHTDDTIGAELGGALKNVVAIAAGIAIGAGLGENARAAIISRGFAEMGRLSEALGGRKKTLAGLSGLGDLILTAMSEKSRNTRAGIAIGRGNAVDPATTTEGIATARAVETLASKLELSAPVISSVAGIVDGRLSVAEARDMLLARPLGRE